MTMGGAGRSAGDRTSAWDFQGSPLRTSLGRRVAGGLGVLLMAALTALAMLPKPWSEEMAARRVDPGVVDHVLLWGWLALAGNAFLLTGLLATLRYWLRSGPVRRVAFLDPPASRPSFGWAGLVLAAALTCGALAAPRLSHSLWNDEIYNLHKSIDGHWVAGEDGRFERRDRSWIETLWRYRTPNNHVPHSLLARLTLTSWRALGEGRQHRVDESILRLPAYVAGMAAIVAAALLPWRLGFPAAGLVLAWILALHPWVLRYASEARGYTMLLLLVAVHATLLVHVLARGTWGRWSAYGAVQVLLLWLYPAAFKILAASNGAALLAVVFLHRGSSALNVQLARFVVTQLATAGIWLQIMAPNLAQLVIYMNEQLVQGRIGLRWLLDVGSFLFVGMPYKRPPIFGPHFPQLLDRSQGSVPLPYLAGAALTLVAIAAGTVRLALRGKVHALLALTLLLPGPVTWLVAYVRDVFLWQWYLLFMLPLWGTLAALGLTWPGQWAATRPARVLAGALAVTVIVGFACAGAPARDALQSRSLQPRRESVLLTRASLDPNAEGQERVLTASFSVVPTHYDPGVVVVENVLELRALMERADRTRFPLYVNLGGLAPAESHSPELTELVVRGGLFEEVALLRGFEPRFSRHVFRYRGASPPPAGGDTPQ